MQNNYYNLHLSVSKKIENEKIRIFNSFHNGAIFLLLILNYRFCKKKVKTTIYIKNKELRFSPCLLTARCLNYPSN